MKREAFTLKVVSANNRFLCGSYIKVFLGDFSMMAVRLSIAEVILMDSETKCFAVLCHFKRFIDGFTVLKNSLVRSAIGVLADNGISDFAAFIVWRVHVHSFLKQRLKTPPKHTMKRHNPNRVS